MKRRITIAVSLIAMLSLAVSCGGKKKSKKCVNPISMTDGTEISLDDLPEGYYGYDSAKVYLDINESGENAKALITEQVLAGDSENASDVDIACHTSSSKNLRMYGEGMSVSSFLKLDGETKVYSMRKFSVSQDSSNLRAEFSPLDEDTSKMLKTLSVDAILYSLDEYKFFKIDEQTYELRGALEGAYISITYVLNESVLESIKALNNLGDSAEELKKHEEDLKENLQILEDLQKKLQELEVEPTDENSVTPEKEILLEQEEVSVANIGNAKILVRDYDSGKVTSLNTKAEVETYASQNGFDSNAAGDGYQISSATGGITGFSPENKYTANAITDMLAHIKSNMNSNSGDLDLAFVIDYSGSMGDDIEAVIEGLSKITYSLQAIIDSGRNVRTSIVTFGNPGNETVELDFTTDMQVVRKQLERLLSYFSDNKHSTDPGEAWYHGIAKATDKLTWASENRSMITITDERSYEIASGMNSFISETNKKLTQNNIGLKIYNIIVK